MAEHTDDFPDDCVPDLLATASRTCEHARLTLELIARQASLAGFRPPTDYQVYSTERVARTFVTAVTERYLTAAAMIDAGMHVAVEDVAMRAIDPDLIAIALARSDEHWITQALRTGATGTLRPLMPDEDAEEAELTLALLQAVDRRVDAQGDPLMIDEDVGHRILERLVWRIAAEVRALLVQRAGDVDDIDRTLTTAARQVLKARRHRSPPAAERVAQRLLKTDPDLSALLRAALDRAQPRLFCALIAARLRLPAAFVMRALTQPEQLALFLKAAGLSDHEAAALFLKLAVPLRLQDDRLIAIIEGYRSLKNRATVEMLRQSRLDPGYRAAIREQERHRASR